MAKDFKSNTDLFGFHPCDVPKGIKGYNLKDITDDQQMELNIFKLEELKSNHKYIKNHPEIKAIVSTLLRAVLKRRPLYDIEKFFAVYLNENRSHLQELIEKVKKQDSLASVTNDTSLALNEQESNQDEIPDLIPLQDAEIFNRT